MEVTMLRDGQFLRDRPIEISAHYVPDIYPNQLTKEEQFFQAWLLGVEQKKQSMLSKLLGFMLRI
jgi:hypothetical protein